MKILVSLLIVMSFVSCRAVQEETDFNVTKHDQKVIDDNDDGGSPPAVAPPSIGTPVAAPPIISPPVENIQEFIERDDLVGLSGGHFDLDTSTDIVDFDNGYTNHHEHEYDNKYDSLGADFFDLKNRKFDEIDDAIGNENFIIIVANSNLSPGAKIVINGIEHNSVDYQNNVKKFLNGDQSALQIYNLNGDASGSLLNQFQVKFDKDVIKNGGLLPTNTGCVKKNEPGKNGEYRNGALTLQVINVDQPFQIDSKLGIAKLGSDLLWEATIFWHWEGPCYK